MNNLLKRIHLSNLTLFLVCIFLSPSLTVGVNTALLYETTVCDPPANVYVTSQSQGQVSFAWDSLDEEATYRVWYQREGDSNPGPTSTTTTNSIDFQNLPSGNYTFYFARICGKEVSGYIIFDDLIL